MKQPELPSIGLVARITKALDFAFPPTEDEGRRGQIAKAHREMVKAFGGKAPHQNAISRWKDGKFVPDLDNAFMLARALGQPPEWLAFNIGEMATVARTFDEEPYERTARPKPTEKRKPRRAG